MMLPRSIDELLSMSSRALDNSVAESDIATRLANFGYTADKIQEGRHLYEEALQLHQLQQDRYGDQYKATEEFEAKWEAAKELYSRHVRLARIAFEGDRGIWQALAINGRRPKAFGTWLQVARKFYTKALADETIKNRLAEVGVTETELQEGQARLDAVEAAEHVQEAARGNAQAATKLRDPAVAALRDWMEDFLTVASVALKDQPQLAEKLGVLVRS